MMPRSEGQASLSRLVLSGFRRRGEDRGSPDNPRRSRGVGNPGDPARLRAAPGLWFGQLLQSNGPMRLDGDHMPVSFENLEFRRLLHHKLAYECIDAVGGSLYDDWDVIQFEKSVLGAEYCPAFKREDELAILRQELLRLDGQMPFLRFGEEGTHHAYELFLSEPGFWGSRGAPLFWAYAAREFTTDILPLDPRLLVQKYLAVAYELGIPYGVDEYAYIERFAAGGMSSGQVGGAFVEEGLKTLLRRLPLYGGESRLLIHYYNH